MTSPSQTYVVFCEFIWLAAYLILAVFFFLAALLPDLPGCSQAGAKTWPAEALCSLHNQRQASFMFAIMQPVHGHLHNWNLANGSIQTTKHQNLHYASLSGLLCSLPITTYTPKTTQLLCETACKHDEASLVTRDFYVSSWMDPMRPQVCVPRPLPSCN